MRRRSAWSLSTGRLLVRSSESISRQLLAHTRASRAPVHRGHGAVRSQSSAQCRRSAPSTIALRAGAPALAGGSQHVAARGEQISAVRQCVLLRRQCVVLPPLPEESDGLLCEEAPEDAPSGHATPTARSPAPYAAITHQGPGRHFALRMPPSPINSNPARRAASGDPSQPLRLSARVMLPWHRRM